MKNFILRLLCFVSLSIMVSGCGGRRSEMEIEVVRILTFEWNPTSQPPEVLARHDYSSYAPVIIRMLNAKATKQAISNELLSLETSNMKLLGDRARCDRVADMLVNLTKGS